MNRADRRLNIHYGIILGAYWTIFAVSSIFTVALLRTRGFDDGQIGILLALRSISAIVVSPLAASFLDRHPLFPIKNVLVCMLAVNVVNTLVFHYMELGYAATAATFVVLGATTNTMPSLHSSIAVKFQEGGRDLIYSIGRGAGSVCYALGSLALSTFVGESGYGLSLTLQLLLDVFSLIVIIFFPVCPGERTGGLKEDASLEEVPPRIGGEAEMEAGPKAGGPAAGKVHSTWELITGSPRFALFLLASILIFVGYNMCNSFMIDIIVSRGGDNQDLGISCFILGMAELPTALFFPKLHKKFGTKFLLNVSSVFALLKMICLYLSPNVICIFFSQLIQMLGNGMYWHVSVCHVHETVSLQDQVKGQSLTTMASVNIGAILGSSVSGKLLCRFDIDDVIIFGCICTFMGVVCMAAATLGQRTGSRAQRAFSRYR